VCCFPYFGYQKLSKTFWLQNRVAVWFIFVPNILIWVNFAGPNIVIYWYILPPFGILYRYLRYFMTICYILCSFATFFPVLVECTKKHLATLLQKLPRVCSTSEPKPTYMNGFVCLCVCGYVSVCQQCCVVSIPSYPHVCYISPCVWNYACESILFCCSSQSVWSASVSDGGCLLAARWPDWTNFRLFCGCKKWENLGIFLFQRYLKFMYNFSPIY
jgi:hypothetical protein